MCVSGGLGPADACVLERGAADQRLLVVGVHAADDMGRGAGQGD